MQAQDIRLRISDWQFECLSTEWLEGQDNEEAGTIKNIVMVQELNLQLVQTSLLRAR